MRAPPGDDGRAPEAIVGVDGVVTCESWTCVLYFPPGIVLEYPEIVDSLAMNEELF